MLFHDNICIYIKNVDIELCYQLYYKYHGVNSQKKQIKYKNKTNDVNLKITILLTHHEKLNK